MPHTVTHTYAILEVSPSTYKEIKEALEKGGYGEQFHTQSGYGLVIDMHGIAIGLKPEKCQEFVRTYSPSATKKIGQGIADLVSGRICNATMVICEECSHQWCLDHTPNPLVCPNCKARPYPNQESEGG